MMTGAESAAVIIQNRVPAFTIRATPALVDASSGQSTITVTLSTNLYPTSVFCDWMTNDVVQATTYSTTLTSSQTDQYAYTFTSSDVGVTQSVNVSCYNLVSEENSQTEVEVHEAITGLAVSVQPPAVRQHQAFRQHHGRYRIQRHV